MIVAIVICVKRCRDFKSNVLNNGLYTKVYHYCIFYNNIFAARFVFALMIASSLFALSEMRGFYNCILLNLDNIKNKQMPFHKSLVWFTKIPEIDLR